MGDIKLKPLRFIGSSLPLKGLPGVMEIVSRYDTDTYRSVYVADIGGVVFVWHCFKKKSTQGIKTSKPDMHVIRRRLRAAQEAAKEI